jgi:BRCA1-associated protein
MVIIKFLNPADAAEFTEAYNGKPFNSMEVGTLFVCLTQNHFK